MIIITVIKDSKNIGGLSANCMSLSNDCRGKTECMNVYIFRFNVTCTMLLRMCVASFSRNRNTSDRILICFISIKLKSRKKCKEQLSFGLRNSFNSILFCYLGASFNPNNFCRVSHWIQLECANIDAFVSFLRNLFCRTAERSKLITYLSS